MKMLPIGTENQLEMLFWKPGMTLFEAKLAVINLAIKNAGGNLTQAARDLEITRVTVYKYLKIGWAR